MLTKMFSSKQAHKTEQKTYLRFFIAGIDLSQIRFLEFFALNLPFKSVPFKYVRYMSFLQKIDWTFERYTFKRDS